MCGKCAEVYPTKAMEMPGELITVKEVMTEVKKEVLLMDNSKGGVTFSGGEPLLYHNHLIQLLDVCADEGIHRCIDTSSFADKRVLLKVAERSELFLYDLKMMDSAKHKKIDKGTQLENIKNPSITGRYCKGFEYTYSIDQRSK